MLQYPGNCKIQERWGGGFPYKIVIGEPIIYKARNGSGTNWQWDLGDWNSGVFTPYWTGLSPQTPTSFSDDGAAIIPGTLVNMPVSNNDLGPAHGLIRVTDGIDTTYSKNVLDLPADEYAGPEVEVSLFYRKDDSTFTQTHPLYAESNGSAITSYIPNWFHYWKQLIPEDFLKLPGIKLFNKNTCQFEGLQVETLLNIVYGHITYKDYREVFKYSDSLNVNNTYGANRFNAASNYTINVGPGAIYCPDYPENTNVVTEYDLVFHHALIGKGCGYKKADPRDLTQQTSIRGLHAFFSTVVHEREHALIECEIWANGYSKALDEDMDGYSNVWEEMHLSDGFDPMDPSDKYNSKYRIENGVIEEMVNNVWVPGSAGTVYEETRCRNKEQIFLNTMQYMFDNHDWSFDPTYINQGKNYKK